MHQIPSKKNKTIEILTVSCVNKHLYYFNTKKTASKNHRKLNKIN